MMERRRYSKRVRSYKEGYISVSIYLNVTDERRHYDTVIFRKIKSGRGFEWKRGTNYKPGDLPVIVRLLNEAHEFLKTVEDCEPGRGRMGL